MGTETFEKEKKNSYKKREIEIVRSHDRLVSTRHMEEENFYNI